MGRSVLAAPVSWIRTASSVRPRRPTLRYGVTGLVVVGGYACVWGAPAHWAWIGVGSSVALVAALVYGGYRSGDPASFAESMWAAFFAAAIAGALSVFRTGLGDSSAGLAVGLAVLVGGSLVGDLLTGLVIEQRMGGASPASAAAPRVR